MLDKELLLFIKGKRYYLVLSVLFNTLSLLFNIGLTFSLVYSLYSFVNLNYSDGINYLLLTLFLIFFRILGGYLANSYSIKLANYVTSKLRKETYNKFLSLNTNIPFSINEMSQLSTEGIEQLRLYYSNYLPSFFYSMIAPLILFIVFSFINIYVSLVYLICIPLIPLSIIMVSKWAKKLFNKYWDIYLSLGDSFLDNLRGMKELKIFLYSKKREEELKNSSEDFRKITMKVLTMQLYSVTIMDFVAYGGASIGIVLSLNAIMGGLIWYLVLFLIILGSEFFLPLRRLGSAFHVAMNGMTAGKKIIKLLKIDEVKRDIELTESIKSIDVDNLSYHYENKDNVLNDINLHLETGFYSLIGVSGSGKSTLGKILLNVINGYEGQVLINNKYPLNRITLNSFYSKSAYISSSTFIFSKSIRELFHFYNPTLSDEMILSLLKKVKMDQFISLHGGLDYKINDKVSNISLGEKQRLIIACYLANDYDFYIFDEATSSIDMESEKIILDIILELSKTKIVINITHRIKNSMLSKEIFYLENSRIVEKGSFDTLMKQDGKYQKVYNYQLSLEGGNYE